MTGRLSKEEYKSQLSLTILVAAIVFGVLMITVFLSAIIVYLLFQAEAISDPNMLLNPLRVLSSMLIISLVIGAVIAFFSSQISMRIVNNIIIKMDRLSSGDFKTRLVLTGSLNNVSLLVKVADSFNKMAEELERTEVLRSDFINNFSHEFKTPIVSIAGFAKVLKRGNLTDEQKLEYVDIIEEESLRLASMATNVLNLTKIENQTILTDLSEYNLSEQIRSAVLLLERKWLQKNLEFDLDFHEHTILANEELLKQVWINLIDNAIKFSSDGGVVVIKIGESDGFLSVTVSNYGTEIPSSQQRKIFNKFYQADESHATAGNGIGLAIVKRVVDLHEGSISVSSGQGKTTFTVELPQGPVIQERS